jgi:hypothetical protein
MNNNAQQGYATHNEMLRLLPWYVNKTLHSDELSELESHLRGCLICKRELMQLEKLAKAVVMQDVLDSAENASFARLKKRLHQKMPEQQHSDRLLQPSHAASNITQLSSKKMPIFNKPRVDWVLRSALAVAAVLLIALLVPLKMTAYLQTPNNFRTLSNAEPNPLSAAEIRVVFANDVTQEKIKTILTTIGGQLVENNPTEQGVYTVKLSSSGKTQVLDMLNILKQDKRIIFAEPAYALLSSTNHRGEK